MTRRRALLWLLTATLFGGAMLYHAKGLLLLFQDKGGGDVKLRWQEQQYVIRGQNPYDITFSVLGVGRPPSDPTRNTLTVQEIGVPDSGGYPPWAFLFGYLMFWPPWPAVKAYFLTVSLALTAVSAFWAYRAVRPLERSLPAGWVAAAAVLAVSGYSTCVHVGQYGAVVVGLLALSAWALSNGWQTVGGILMGVALLKPTIGGPFVMILLVTGRWRALAACVVYVGIACAAIWLQTRTPPWEMFLQSVAVGEGFVQDSQGLVNALIGLGLTPKQVTPVLALGVGLPGLIGLYLYRHRPLVDLFAAASVIGRLWAYHKSYDNMMLEFLLVALAAAAFVRGTPIAWASFLVVGITVWMPASLSRSDWFLFLQIAVWLSGLLILFVRPATPTSFEVPLGAVSRERRLP
jgi:hypothetical protein